MVGTVLQRRASGDWSQVVTREVSTAGGLVLFGAILAADAIVYYLSILFSLPRIWFGITLVISAMLSSKVFARTRLPQVHRSAALMDKPGSEQAESRPASRRGWLPSGSVDERQEWARRHFGLVMFLVVMGTFSVVFVALLPLGIGRAAVLAPFISITAAVVFFVRARDELGGRRP